MPTLSVALSIPLLHDETGVILQIDHTLSQKKTITTYGLSLFFSFSFSLCFSLNIRLDYIPYCLNGVQSDEIMYEFEIPENLEILLPSGQPPT